MSAQVIAAFSTEELWRRRIRLFARWRLIELGASDAEADQIIAELLKHAEQMPAAASDPARLEDYFGRVVVSCSEILWRRLHSQIQP